MGARIVFFNASIVAGSTFGMVLLSRMNAMAPLAAIRPSACEPEENLWLDAPTPSPAEKRPLTVVMWLYTPMGSHCFLYSAGMTSSGPHTHAPEAPECEPMK